VAVRPYRAPMDFEVLGPLRVLTGGTEVPIRGSKERTLLAHLIAYAGQVVPTADLIDSLWGDEPPRSAAKSLQTYVLRVRNALEPDRRSGQGLLVTDGPGYRLAITPADTDAGRFSRLAALAGQSLEAGRYDACRAAAVDALALWRGPPYAGCEDTPFGQAEARRLSELRLGVVERRLEAELGLGRHAAVVADLERLVGEHPLHEHLWSLLITALYRCDRQGDALAAYDRVRSLLADELGVDPGPELRAVHARVLAHDPALAAPRALPNLPAGLADLTTPMLGRDHELQRLVEAWHRAQAGTRVIAVVRGPAGAGATRLVSALAADVTRDGAEVALAPVPAGDNGPLLLVADGTDAQPPAHGMLVRLVGPRSQPAPGAVVIDLAPLIRPDVVRLVEPYVGADAESAADELLATGPAWPGRLHSEAAQLARIAATRRVAAAADVADASSAQLASARAVLSEGIATLAETRAPQRPETDRCPWRGLLSYDVDDAPWFAGRERLVAELVARLAGSRMVALVGASGSGKSSALRAGMLAALRDDVLPGSGAWRQVVMRPGRHPMRELARQALGGPQAELGDLLASMVGDQSGEPRTLLVVDQLEELWTLCQDEGERAAFLDAIAELITDPASTTTAAVAIRADWIGALAEHPALAAPVATGTVLVGSPTAAEVERAVRRPALRAGLTFDDGLVETITGDAGAEPGLLPLLSVALTQLWERRVDGRLTYAAYVASGGLAGAIAAMAEDVWRGLDAEQQEAARAVFLRLAGAGDADGDMVTRRRMSSAEVRALAHPATRRVVDTLVAARLLSRSDEHVEVAHEALFREWPRLRDWLADDASGRAVLGRLSLAAAEWDAEGRDSAVLWRGTRLESAVEVAEVRPEEITSTERAFLAASQDAVEAEQRAIRTRAENTARQNRRLRWLLVGLVVLLVAAAVAGVVAVRARSRADAAADQAQSNATSARARALAASALNEEYPDLGLLEAVEAVRVEQGPETYGALLTLLTRNSDILTRYRTFDRFLRIGSSEDGRLVYLTDNEKTLWAVDALTGELRWKAEGPDGSFILAPNVVGERVLAPYLGFDGAPHGVLVIDARTGALEREVAVPADSGRRPDWIGEGVALHGDNLLVITPEAVLQISPNDGHIVRRVPWRVPHTQFSRFLPDGRVVGEDGSGHSSVLDLGTGETRRIEGMVAGASDDGQQVATVVHRRDNVGGIRSVVRLRDARTWRSLAVRPLEGEALQVAFTQEHLVVAVAEDVQVLDRRSLAPVQRYRGNSGAVLGVAVAGPDHDVAWTAGRDGSALAFDLSHTRSMISTRPVTTPLGLGAADDQGRIAIQTPLYDDRVNPARLIDATTGRDLFGELPLPRGCGDWCQVGSVAMAGDGSLAIGVIDRFLPDMGDFEHDYGRMAVWDTADGSLLRSTRVLWQLTGLAISPDNGRAMLGGRRGYGVFDLTAGAMVWQRTRDQQTAGSGIGPLVGWSPDGRHVMLLEGTRATLLDAATGTDVISTQLDDASELTRVVWSADGRTAVLASTAGRLYFLDSGTLEPVAPQRLITAGFVLDLELSLDGSMLAARGTDGDVTLFDTATWRPYGKPITDGLLWGFMVFTPGQLRIFSELGSVTTVAIDPDAWVEAACRVANRDLSPEEFALVNPGEDYRPTCS